MCNVWKHPTRVDEEFRPEHLETLPKLSFCNITGGEPFLRDDIEDIIALLQRKSKRIVVSTNGYFTEKIIDVTRKNGKIGIRISIEGLPSANDELRGIKDGFDHAIRTLLELARMGVKDIGFGITVSDRNASDMIELYQLAKSMNLEFATAVVHNSYYFHKHDNIITRQDEVAGCFEELVRELLKSRRVKDWFRAYFNSGLVNRIRGNRRLLPCEAGTENFFVTPSGDVVPCNGSDEPWVIGNLKGQTWAKIWDSDEAREMRRRVKSCSRNCWMIGTAAPVMRKYLWKPATWIARNKWSDSSKES
jgi:MoaA/NifB/PqqE/SkfB family radical SAM enzyme